MSFSPSPMPLRLLYPRIITHCIYEGSFNKNSTNVVSGAVDALYRVRRAHTTAEPPAGSIPWCACPWCSCSAGLVLLACTAREEVVRLYRAGQCALFPNLSRNKPTHYSEYWVPPAPGTEAETGEENAPPPKRWMTIGRRNNGVFFVFLRKCISHRTDSRWIFLWDKIIF